MSKTNIKPIVDNENSYKSICDGLGCSNSSVKKINVGAGTFGSITLNLCSKCVKLFDY
jgi:hypothetical protein